MSYATERAAIATRWQALWVDTTGAPRTPTQFEGIVFEPPKLKPWVRLGIVNGAALQISAGCPGSNTHRHAGIVTVQFFVPAGTGTAELRELGDTAAAIFRALRITAADNDYIQFQAPSFRVMEPEAVWHPALLTAPFYRDALL